LARAGKEGRIDGGEGRGAQGRANFFLLSFSSFIPGASSHIAKSVFLGILKKLFAKGFYGCLRIYVVCDFIFTTLCLRIFRSGHSVVVNPENIRKYTNAFGTFEIEIEMARCDISEAP